MEKKEEVMAEMWGLRNGDSEEEEEAPVGVKGKWSETWEYHPLWAWGFVLLQHGYFVNEMYLKAGATGHREKRWKERKKERQNGGTIPASFSEAEMVMYATHTH